MFRFQESAAKVKSLQVRDSSVVDLETNDGSPRVTQLVTVRIPLVIPFDVWSAPVLASDSMSRAIVQMAMAQDSAESAGGAVESRFALKGKLCEGESSLTLRRYYDTEHGEKFIESRLQVDFVGAPTIAVRDAKAGSVSVTVEAMVETHVLCELAALVKSERVTAAADFVAAQTELFSATEHPADDDDCCDGAHDGAMHLQPLSALDDPEYDLESFQN